MGKNGRDRGSSSNIGTRDRSCKDDDLQQKARLHYFQFLRKRSQTTDMFFSFFPFCFERTTKFQGPGPIIYSSSSTIEGFCDSE